MEELVRDLEYYKPKKSDKIESRKEVLKNARKTFRGINLIVNAFREGIFPFSKEEMS